MAGWPSALAGLIARASIFYNLLAKNNSSDWRQMLRAARKALKLDQAELARAAGISRETRRSYELGRRVPRRDQLEALFVPLRLPEAVANEIREALGFATTRSRFVSEFGTYYFSRDELAAHTALQPWPEFVVNDAMEVDAVNAACEAIWDIDFAWEKANRPRAAMNLLSVASDRHFADKVLNWHEVVGMMAGIAKAMAMNMEQQSPYFAEVLAEFSKGDPAFLQGLLDAFAAAEPQEAKIRWVYPVVWRVEPFGTMNLHCTVCVASEPEALSFNSWIPRDAASWRVLEDVKQAHEAKRAEAHRD